MDESASDAAPRGTPDLQGQADQLLDGLVMALDQEESALALAVVANRAATRLHNLARSGAAERKDTAAWPVWAKLQNAARSLVLQASTARDMAAAVAGRRR